MTHRHISPEPQQDGFLGRIQTADTLAALREAKGRHRPVLAVTNVASSSMAREADVSMSTVAGVERAILATKSFTTQLIVLRLLSLLAAQVRSEISPGQLGGHLQRLRNLPSAIDSQLDGWQCVTQQLADVYRSAKTLIYLGRGVHYAIAREGALKLKEASYIHAEGYPTGELKHGPNALVSDEVPLVVLATVDRKDSESLMRDDKTVALLDDMRLQGARIIAVCNRDVEAVRARASHVIEVDFPRVEGGLAQN